MQNSLPAKRIFCWERKELGFASKSNLQKVSMEIESLALIIKAVEGFETTLELFLIRKTYLRAPFPVGTASLLDALPELAGALPTIDGLPPRDSFPSFPASFCEARDALLLS